MKNWRKVSTIQEDTALISPRMSNGIFVFLETTETTVALSGAVYKLCDSRSSENAARGLQAQKNVQENSKNISLKFLSLPHRLRSEKFLQTRLFFNPSFHKFRVFYLFSSRFKREENSVSSEKKKHSHMFSFVDWWKQRASERKKGKLDWNLAKLCEKDENGFSCVKRERERASESKRRSDKKNIIAINNFLSLNNSFVFIF
jgi:hypothetical protein